MKYSFLDVDGQIDTAITRMQDVCAIRQQRHRITIKIMDYFQSLWSLVGKMVVQFEQVWMLVVQLVMFEQASILNGVWHEYFVIEDFVE